MKIKSDQAFIFTALAFVVICFLSTSTFAQRVGFKAAEPESVDDPTTVKCKAGTQWYVAQILATGFGFDSPESAQSVTEEVLRAAGYLPKVITAKAAIVGNAAACRSYGDDYILYDSNWFKSLYADTEEKWADRAIFAHEIGHFERNHYRRGLGSTPELELEADEVAGELLARMGATLEQALAAFSSARMRSAGSHTHPATNQRLLAVEKGWRKVNSHNSTEQKENLADNQQARALVDSGDSYLEKREYDKAVAVYTKAIEISSQFADAYNSRGWIFYLKQEYDKAIADYTKAIEIDPKFASAYNNRGFAYGIKKEYEKAIADYTKAIEINPKYASTFSNRAKAYRAIGKNDLAEADEQRAKELNNK